MMGSKLKAYYPIDILPYGFVRYGRLISKSVRNALPHGVCLLLMITIWGTENKSFAHGSMEIQRNLFGHVEGIPVYLYTMINNSGMEVTITNYGGTITALKVPDRDGKIDDVVLGFDSLDGYLGKHPYFGATVGRYANRIGQSTFTLDGKKYDLTPNDGRNHLHGGARGFSRVVWNAETSSNESEATLTLKYRSKDEEEGYPGNVDVKVTFTLNHNNELKISYHATTDKPTIVNLTNHSYFNLAGTGNGDISRHLLEIHADSYTPKDKEHISTGEILPVADTVFDFRKPTPMGKWVDSEQLKWGRGYGHNWILNKNDTKMTLAARVFEPNCGRVMEIFTEDPGLVFYSGNGLNGSNVGKGNKPYGFRYGFCLEPGYFPDSPNWPNFPSPILRPGQVYNTQTVYKFYTK